MPTLDYYPNAKIKYSIDPVTPYTGEGVIPVYQDFAVWQSDEPIEFGTCMQVMEHVKNPSLFAKNLLLLCEVVLISVPYMEPSGLNPGHIHNMINYDTIVDWFGREPNYHYIATELSGDRRIICLFDTTTNEKFTNIQKLSQVAFQFRFRWS
jgi:hypothetical protein